MDTLFAICVGIGLSAASGFRVFMPMLVLSAATKFGGVHLNPNFEWLGSWTALATFASATVLEAGSYYVPWVAHAVSVAATPAAVLAGTLATAAQIDGVHPLAQWSSSLLVGGGVAGGVQMLNIGARAASTISTAGLGNPIVSLGQGFMAFVLAVAAVVAPLFIALLIVAIVAVLVRRRRARRSDAGEGSVTSAAGAPGVNTTRHPNAI